MINVVDVYVLIENYALLYQLLNARPDTKLPAQLTLQTLSLRLQLVVRLSVLEDVPLLQVILRRPLT